MGLGKIVESLITRLETERDFGKAVNFAERVKGDVLIRPVYNDPKDERSGLDYPGLYKETVRIFFNDPNIKGVAVLAEPIESRILRGVFIPNRKNKNK